MCDLCAFRKLCHCVAVLWKHLLMVTHSELLQYDSGGNGWLQKKILPSQLGVMFYLGQTLE